MFFCMDKFVDVYLGFRDVYLILLLGIDKVYENDRYKIMFVKYKGLYLFKVMFFGFIYSFVIFERLIKIEFIGL